MISVNNPSTRTEPSTSTPNNEPTTQARALTESTVQGTTFARAHTSHAARTSHQADATEVVPWTGRTGRHDIEEITVDPDARDSQHVVYTTRQNGAIGHLTTSWPPLTPPPNYYEVEHTVHVNGGVGGVAGSAIAMPCSSTVICHLFLSQYSIAVILLTAQETFQHVSEICKTLIAKFNVHSSLYDPFNSVAHYFIELCVELICS